MTKALVETLEKVDVKPPKDYKVVFYDDDVTTVGFVVHVLMCVFNKTEEVAVNLATEVHEYGNGVAGIYAYEIAQHLTVVTVDLARANDFPLKVEYEEM